MLKIVIYKNALSILKCIKYFEMQCSNFILCKIYCLKIIFLTGEKPLVECSFITEFEDHIFVTVDAEAFFFLHDLITSYVKEKEKVVITFYIFLN